MYKNKTLDVDCIGKLSLINMVWDTEKEENKNKCIDRLFNNDCNIDSDIEELVKNYGYEALFNFSSIASALTLIKLKQIIDIRIIINLFFIFKLLVINITYFIYFYKISLIFF